MHVIVLAVVLIAVASFRPVFGQPERLNDTAPSKEPLGPFKEPEAPLLLQPQIPLKLNVPPAIVVQRLFEPRLTLTFDSANCRLRVSRFQAKVRQPENAKATQQSALTNSFKRKLEQMAQATTQEYAMTCNLTESQRRKLLLAAQGDIAVQVRRLKAWYARYDLNPAIQPELVKAAASEVSALNQQLHRETAYEGSLYAQILDRILEPAQREQIKNDYLEWFSLAAQRSAVLDDQQRQSLLRQLQMFGDQTSLILPRKKYVASVLRTVPDRELVEVLGAAQAAAVQRLGTYFSNH